MFTNSEHEDAGVFMCLCMSAIASDLTATWAGLLSSLTLKLQRYQC